MAFPAQNQTFQQGNFNGYTHSGARRVADSAFDARMFLGDTLRDPWNTDQTLYGSNFAVLDGVGMRGTNKQLAANGLRKSSSGTVNLSAWKIDCGNGFAIRGGQGTYLRCPIDVDPGHGVRFVWRFGSTLISPSFGLDYVGFAMVRFLDSNKQPLQSIANHPDNLLCTTRDMPAFINFPSFGKLQTDGWRAHNLTHIGVAPLVGGYVEWIVSSGHYYQLSNGADPDLLFNPAKAKAYPCCLAIDHIVLI